MHIETWKRSAAKTVSYRLTGTLGAMAVVLALTRKPALALAAGSFDMVFALFLFYAHERLWNNMSYGRVSVTPAVLWLTGLPSSGKTSVAQLVAEELARKGLKAQVLDGDAIRSIFPQTGFSRDDRNLHVMRVGYLASILEKQGIFVIVSLVSPYADARAFARGLCSNFVEIHVATPIEVCQQRDDKGLYARARRGEIKNVTGLNDPYEAPASPDLVVDTSLDPPETACRTITQHVERRFVRS